MPWQELESNAPDSPGQKYYYNNETGETTWDKPKPSPETEVSVPNIQTGNLSSALSEPESTDPTLDDWEEQTDRKGATWRRKKGTNDKWEKKNTGSTASDDWEEQTDRKGATWYRKKGTTKWEKKKPGSVASSSPAAAVVFNETPETERELKLTKWIDLGNGQWQNQSTAFITKEKPTPFHKKRDNSGNTYYYSDSDGLDDGNHIKIEVDELSDEVTDVILDYNPSQISADKLKPYYNKLIKTNPENLPFPLPEPELEEEQLKTYNIHFINGIYKNASVFSNKINELQESIKDLRSERDDVRAVNQRIEFYNNLLKILEKKIYIYFPHIEFSATGCFLIEDIPDTDYVEDDSEAPNEDIQALNKPKQYKSRKYNIAAYTAPTFESKTIAEKYEHNKLSGDAFSNNKKKKISQNEQGEDIETMEDEYEKGSPEYKFFYKIKFNSCIGECGIIQLQYLLIQNIMTESDPTINTTGHNINISRNNSILIINSGVDSNGEIIQPSDDSLEYIKKFEDAGVEITRFHDIIESTEMQNDAFKIMFENNYRRNVLEMLYFYSDNNNVKIEDIKPFKGDMPDMANKLFSAHNAFAATHLNAYPAIVKAPDNFITGGGNKPKQIQMFLDRLKRLYNQYVRRRNKRTKKRLQKKRTTRRNKNKGGNKKSKKN
jgi:hypothetical protein